jgi:hypothetical protein
MTGAVAMVGPAVALPGTHPDADLLERRQFEVLRSKEIKSNRASNDAAEVADREIERHLDFAPGPNMSGPQGKQWLETFSAVRAELGTDDVINRNGADWDKLDELYRRIATVTPKTIAGIAIMARAAAVIGMEAYWDKPLGDLDWEKHVARQLIEQICAAVDTGLPFHSAEI